MKFNSLLLAAASLFALANAASSVSPQGLDPVALAGPDPARCGTYCHQPWLKCVADHGGGEYAEWFCNCKQFNNPDNFCRHSGKSKSVNNLGDSLMCGVRMCTTAQGLLKGA